MKILPVLLFLPLLVFTFPADAESGIVMEQIRYQKGKSDKQPGTILIEDNKLRFNDLEANYSSVLDIENERIYILDHNSRTYVSTDMDRYFSTIQKKIKEMEKQAENHLSSLPPEQQETVKKMMKKNKIESGKKDKSMIQVKKTGDASIVAGEETVKYEVYKDGRLTEEMWITEREDLRQEMDFEKLSETLKKFKSLSNGASADLRLHTDQYTEVFKNGFPVKTVDYSFGNAVFVEEVTSIKQQELKDELFLPDPQYEEKSLESIFE